MASRYSPKEKGAKKMKYSKLIIFGIIIMVVLILLLAIKTGLFEGKSKSEKQSEIITTIHRNDTKKLKKLIDDGYPINFISKEGFTPLETALNDRAFESTIILLKNKAYINKKSPFPLFVQIVSTLSEYDQINADSSNYKKIITTYKSILKLALSNKSNNINAKNQLGNSALQLAASTGHPEIIKYLLDNGSNPITKNNIKETPLLIAIKAGNIMAVKQLYKYHKETLDIDNEGNEIFYSAAMNGRTDVLRYLLQESKEDINSQNKEGKTALIIAAEYGYTDIVKLLLDNGANMLIKSNEGKTALDYATKWNHSEIEKLLKS